MDAEEYCPICGRKIFLGHRCAKKDLDAIDRKHERALRRESEAEFDIPENRPYGERLEEGFSMVNPDND